MPEVQEHQSRVSTRWLHGADVEEELRSDISGQRATMASPASLTPKGDRSTRSDPRHDFPVLWAARGPPSGIWRRAAVFVDRILEGAKPARRRARREYRSTRTGHSRGSLVDVAGGGAGRPEALCPLAVPAVRGGSDEILLAEVKRMRQCPEDPASRSTSRGKRLPDGLGARRSPPQTSGRSISVIAGPSNNRNGTPHTDDRDHN